MFAQDVLLLLKPEKLRFATLRVTVCHLETCSACMLIQHEHERRGVYNSCSFARTSVRI